MPVLPRKHDERVKFFQNRKALWTANATQIGLTTAEVTALDVKTTAAAAAIAAAEVARDNAKSATKAADDAVAAMTAAGSEMIKKIKVKAGEVGDSVYPLSNIPAPAEPAPRGLPGECTNFAVELQADGSLLLKWKSKQPVGAAGTMYQIWRRPLGSLGEFAYVGGCGSKEFVDATVPAASAGVTYKVQAVRSTGAGPWTTVNVSFGAPPAGGAMTAQVGDVTTMPKMAA